MKSSALRIMMASTLFVLLAAAIRPARADLVVAATISDDYNSNSILGTLDLTTRLFTPIATESVLVISLTSGANGTLYAGASDGNLYTLGMDGTSTRFGSVSDPYLLSGLAYAGASGFYALQADINPLGADSLRISPDGNSATTPNFLGEQFIGFGSTGGVLTYGPNGTLYFDALSWVNSQPGPVQLFGLDPTTGVATVIGTGLGVGYDLLALVTAGGTLYGIDSVQPSGSGPITIDTIDPQTGLATPTGIDVTGLPAGYTLDTLAVMTASVPEPCSLTMLLTAACMTLAGLGWTGRRKPVGIRARSPRSDPCSAVEQKRGRSDRASRGKRKELVESDGTGGLHRPDVHRRRNDEGHGQHPVRRTRTDAACGARRGNARNRPRVGVPPISTREDRATEGAGHWGTLPGTPQCLDSAPSRTADHPSSHRASSVGSDATRRRRDGAKRRRC
jgi:hypothetical protein